MNPEAQSDTGVPPVIDDSTSDTGVPPVIDDSTSDTGVPPVSHFVPMRADDKIEKRRRNLPHWEQNECTYFVTYRLADSLPGSKLAELREEKENWKRQHPEPWTPQTKKDFYLFFNRRIERWLDSGFGSCLLKTRDVREIVEGSLTFFHGKRYNLDCYVVMPDHVHVLVRPFRDCPLSGILHTWKSFSAHRMNRLLKAFGCIWMDEYFDHIVRSERQLDRFREYIASNPERAGLSCEHFGFQALI